MKRILVAVDFSPHAQSVIHAATELARGLGGHVTLVHVAAPDPDFVGFGAGPDTVRDARAQELREEHRQLHDWAEAVRSENLEAEALLIQGPTAETIVAEADKVGADMIVVGSLGRGPLARVLLGSVSEGVLRRSSRPVLVVPPSEGS